MRKLWKIPCPDPTLIQELSERASIAPVLAQLLIGRGIQELDRFLDPKLTDLRDPELLPGLTKAADLLHDAIQAGQPIVVYGDYDADGMTATSILMGVLRLLRANATYHIPNRLEDGYGLNSEALRKLASLGKKVVVTVDCGIGSVQEAELCKSLGMQLIITDHHQFGERLPDADAIVHPALPHANYPFHGLCGAGVAFKLAWGLCQRASQSKKVSPELRKYLLDAIGLAAIGTVADVVPLIDENRVLVRHGLRSLRESTSPGIQALFQITKLSDKAALESEDIGFTLAPRLNAAGRLGQAQLAVELLTTIDADRALALAHYLDKLNSDRESLERSIQIAAGKQIKEHYDAEASPAFVLAAPGWHPGVIGVVAGRLAEKYFRPVIMISLDNVGQKPGTGSARSPAFLNLHQALLACQDYLVSCGGHAAAAGLRIEENNLPAFREAFCEYVASSIGMQRPTPELVIDAEATLGMLRLDTVRHIERMAPFGNGNPRPIICASQVELAEPPKCMGSNDRHLSVRLKQHGAVMRAVAFGQGEWVQPLQENRGPIDIAFRPVINDFRGMSNVELHLVDWRPSQTPVSAPHFADASSAKRAASVEG